MEDVHILNYYGSYSFQDVLEMTPKERDKLINRLLKQFKEEAKVRKRMGSKY